MFSSIPLPNGDAHETGIVQVLGDEQAGDFLQACLHAKVLPVMMVFTHTQDRFYGVQHGDFFQAWNTLPGTDMRVRLGEVHRKVGLPGLDATPYDSYSLTAISRADEAAFLEDIGLDVYTSGIQDTHVLSDSDIQRVVRSASNSDPPLHSEVYHRLL